MPYTHVDLCSMQHGDTGWHVLCEGLAVSARPVDPHLRSRSLDWDPRHEATGLPVATSACPAAHVLVSEKSPLRALPPVLRHLQAELMWQCPQKVVPRPSVPVLQPRLREQHSCDTCRRRRARGRILQYPCTFGDTPHGSNGRSARLPTPPRPASYRTNTCRSEELPWHLGLRRTHG